MPLIFQSNIVDYDLTENPRVFYVYPENLEKSGGSEFTKMMRKHSVQAKPLMIKQRGFKTRDSFWEDKDYAYARKHFIETQDIIKVLLNKHNAVVVVSYAQLYDEVDAINKNSKVFNMFFMEQMNFMRERWSPDAL
tara:strand:+ start:429 stop:836 length:408 start_codon:yes stop_codon:yes gene_type:complete